MIGKFIDTILDEESLPQTHQLFTLLKKGSRSSWHRGEGVYRIHQFEKQEMVVVCKPEDSKAWFDKTLAVCGRVLQRL